MAEAVKDGISSIAETNEIRQFAKQLSELQELYDSRRTLKVVVNKYSVVELTEVYYPLIQKLKWIQIAIDKKERLIAGVVPQTMEKFLPKFNKQEVQIFMNQNP